MIRNNRARSVRSLARVLLFVILVQTGYLASAQTPTEISPNSTDSDLNHLVGNPVVVEGVYYAKVFSSPVIIMGRRAYHLLENPPGKGDYNFPEGRQTARVTGTLYFYDHGHFQRSDYRKHGDHYFFFNVEESQLEIIDPLKEEAEDIFPSVAP